ncbi:Aspartate/ornithine carbamoyltransferase [Lactifluus volemus]|nr:Aspartate/ornithine carbamoyltransferase [Lactifluus volemus]
MRVGGRAQRNCLKFVGYNFFPFWCPLFICPQILNAVTHSHHLKNLSIPWLIPGLGMQPRLRMPSQSLLNKSIALLFSKRSTRTRVAAETASLLLGGRALFLGKEDIQFGVSESARDTARVIGGMCQGIFARVGDHSEIEELAKYSPAPVLNALSPSHSLRHAHHFDPSASPSTSTADPYTTTLPKLPPLTIAYVGDSTNVLHDMLVTYPRLGHNLRIATPPKPVYQAPAPVWERVKELKCDKKIWWGTDPKEAVHGANVVITDTWISMGQEAEYEQRVRDFAGYQVTEALCREGGAHPDWKFMHCLPRKKHEVDDEVFYGPRSLVFPEADNRKWTIMAYLSSLLFGKWDLTGEQSRKKRHDL